MRLGFSPVTAAMLDTAAAFRLADELGLAFVELSHDLHEIAPVLQDPAQVAELSRATGIGTTVHLSYVDLNLASLIPAARRLSIDRSLRGLEFADAVGASCAVLHTGRTYLDHPQANALVADALDDALEQLADSSVPLALENLAVDGGDYVRGPEQLRSLTERHGLVNCLDFGHAHVEGQRDGRPLIDEYLQALGDRVVHLHVHNNHGAADEHLPTPTGTIDYGRYRHLLTGFEGTVCLEILTGEEGVRTSVEHLRGLIKGESP
jgi:sugar phosphate isomerase/epimerase